MKEGPNRAPSGFDAHHHKSRWRCPGLKTFFCNNPPLFFYPILSGLLAPCLSWSSSLCLVPRGLPELWNEVKLPHWHRSLWVALNRSQLSEKACFRGQNGIRCGVDQYGRVVWTWNALLSLCVQTKQCWLQVAKNFSGHWVKSNKGCLMEEKPACICLKDCDQSKEITSCVCTLYIFIFLPASLKQAGFVTEVQYQPVCFTHPGNFQTRRQSKT